MFEGGRRWSKAIWDAGLRPDWTIFVVIFVLIFVSVFIPILIENDKD